MTTALLLLCALIGTASCFQAPLTSPATIRALFASPRRDFLSQGAAASLLVLVGLPAPPAALAAAADESLDDLLTRVKDSRTQLEEIPKLIESEKWDAVRAILAKPPLSDCWSKSARPLLPKYAEAIGEADGDELAALEAKEDAISHLRYLDMAVYNNVFNPIKTEGTNGATKALVQSYYEDPTNEYKASKKAFDEMIELAGN
eukprot:CAMPEP_0119013788 /NCGR_PEP_ID=MMETSP1176-20130426/8977_1 /TAXON_ID=265551 /ORGANISM="Synedropsis recta cf, Strain CCMP1620" /LENGTH=202 /DNA_ID=CAMNT_0006966907 /DNA_START=41 /DNA_END=649 /DNA_ORIENTATION=-